MNFEGVFPKEIVRLYYTEPLGPFVYKLSQIRIGVYIAFVLRLLSLSFISVCAVFVSAVNASCHEIA